MKREDQVYDHIITMNKTFDYEGKKYALLTLTQKGQITELWIGQERNPRCEVHPIFEIDNLQTNRSILGQQRKRRIPEEFFIQNILWGNTRLKVRSSTGMPMEDIQYQTEDQEAPIEQWVDQFKKISHDAITINWINKYIIELESGPDISHLNEDDHIEIETPPGIRRIPVDICLDLKVGMLDEPFEINVPIEHSEEMITIYIHGISLYDLWGEGLLERIQHMDDEASAKRSLEIFKKLCPMDQHMAMLIFATDRKLSLQAYTKEWLDQPGEKHDSLGGIRIIGGGLYRDENGPLMGEHGYELRSAKVGPVDSDYSGTLHIEILETNETLETCNIRLS